MTRGNSSCWWIKVDNQLALRLVCSFYFLLTWSWGPERACNISGILKLNLWRYQEQTERPQVGTVVDNPDWTTSSSLLSLGTRHMRKEAFTQFHPVLPALLVFLVHASDTVEQRPVISIAGLCPVQIFIHVSHEHMKWWMMYTTKFEGFFTCCNSNWNRFGFPEVGCHHNKTKTCGNR